MIRFENINLSYKDTKALENINIELPEHGICGLFGRNGAGKTSLLSLISGYRQQASGNLTVNGQELMRIQRYFPILLIYTIIKRILRLNIR